MSYPRIWALGTALGWGSGGGFPVLHQVIISTTVTVLKDLLNLASFLPWQTATHG